MTENIPRNFAELLQLAVVNYGPKKRPVLALPAGIPAEVLAGISLAAEQGLIETTELPIIDDRIIEEGKADILILSEQDIRDRLSPNKGNQKQRTIFGKLLSHIAVVEFRRQERLILVADGLFSPQPSLSDKVKRVSHLIATAKSLSFPEPKVAGLAAVEVIYPAMSVTVEAAALAMMSNRGQISGGLVDGPLSLDVALEPEAALSKRVKDSAVAGRADCLLAPNSQTAIGMIEAMTIAGGAAAGHLVVGGPSPIIPVFSPVRPETILHSVAMAILSLPRL